MNRNQGCLVGIFKLKLLQIVFDWLQERFGFGRGLSCTGMGCGVILLLLFIVLACSIVTNTNWLHLF